MINESLIMVQEKNLIELEMSYSSYELMLLPTSMIRVIEEGEKDPVYFEQYASGVEMPPPAVIKNGIYYDIVDGNRRFKSAKAANREHMFVMVLEDFYLGTPSPYLLKSQQISRKC